MTLFLSHPPRPPSPFFSSAVETDANNAWARVEELKEQLEGAQKSTAAMQDGEMLRNEVERGLSEALKEANQKIIRYRDYYHQRYGIQSLSF